MYEFTEVPDSGTDRSRYALTTGPGGVTGISPALNINNAYSRLLTLRIAEAEPLAPPAKEVTLKRIARTQDGGYAIVACRPLQAIPTTKPIKSGKFAKRESRSGAFLDAFFSGAREWHTAHDDDVYTAALELADREQLDSRHLRALNESIQLAILARAGITQIRAWDLPL